MVSEPILDCAKRNVIAIYVKHDDKTQFTSFSIDVRLITMLSITSTLFSVSLRDALITMTS